MSFDLADWLYPDATRERQPQGKLELDESSPLARGLYCYFDPLINRLVNDAGVTSSVNNGQRVIGTRGQAHARIDGYGSAINQVLVPGYPATTSDFTLVTLCSVNQSNATAYQVVSTAQSANAIAAAIETGDGSTKGRIRGRAYIGGTRYVGGSFVILDDDMHLLAFRQRYNVEQALFVDGVKDSVTGAWTGPGVGFSYCGAYTLAPYQKIGLSLWYNRALTDGELRALADNPWQLFRPRSLGIFVPATTGGSLNATATGGAVATGAAALAAQVALASVGVSTASGSAALAASVPLSAVGLSVAAGSATPSATVTISAAGLAQAAGQAGLSASVLAQASGAALASGNATLAAQLNALATGAAQAGGSANLSGGAAGSLSASGAAIAAGTAVLSVTVGLQASGSALASGTATGSANAPGQVSAAGGAAAGGSGVMSAQVSITAAGFVQAMGQGAFSATVPLSAFGVVTASGYAHLTVDNGVVMVRAPSGYRSSLIAYNSMRPRQSITIRPISLNTRR